MAPSGGRFNQSRGERLLMSGMVIVAVVACVVMLIDHRSPGGSGDQGDLADLAALAELADGEEAPPKSDPDAPAADPAVAAASVSIELRPAGEPVFIDVFDRPELEGGDLGWATITGSWRIVADEPAGTLSADPTSDGAARGVFVPPAELDDSWELVANVGLPAANMGLVWAVEDAANYWEVRLIPNSAAIVVNQTVEGQTRQVALFGPVGLNPGDGLRIQRDDDSVLLAVGDAVLGAWTHPDLADRRRAGVFAGPDGGGFGSVLVAGLD